LARGHLAHDRAPQLIDDVIGELTAFVEPLVDDRGLLANLREIVAVEIAVAGAGGVREIDVSDPAAGAFVDQAPVPFDPGETPEVFLALHRHDRDVARAAAV